LFDPVRAAISSRRAFFVAAAIFVLLVVANAAWLAAHSGSKPLSQAANENNSSSANAKSQETQNITPTEGDQSSSALPEPTGKIDDTVAQIDKFAAKKITLLPSKATIPSLFFRITALSIIFQRSIPAARFLAPLRKISPH